MTGSCWRVLRFSPPSPGGEAGIEPGRPVLLGHCAKSVRNWARPSPRRPRQVPWHRARLPTRPRAKESMARPGLRHCPPGAALPPIGIHDSFPLGRALRFSPPSPDGVAEKREQPDRLRGERRRQRGDPAWRAASSHRPRAAKPEIASPSIHPAADFEAANRRADQSSAPRRPCKFDDTDCSLHANQQVTE